MSFIFFHMLLQQLINEQDYLPLCKDDKQNYRKETKILKSIGKKKTSLSLYFIHNTLSV